MLSWGKWVAAAAWTSVALGGVLALAGCAVPAARTRVAPRGGAPQATPPRVVEGQGLAVRAPWPNVLNGGSATWARLHPEGLRPERDILQGIPGDGPYSRTWLAVSVPITGGGSQTVSTILTRVWSEATSRFCSGLYAPTADELREVAIKLAHNEDYPSDSTKAKSALDAAWGKVTGAGPITWAAVIDDLATADN